MTQKTLDFDALQITPVDIYEQMGYHGEEPDEATRKEVQAVLEEVRPWLRPQFCYLVVKEQPAFDMGKIIMRQLRGSEAYALFIRYGTCIYSRCLGIGYCRALCRSDGDMSAGEHR